jgi:hypothetical protein
MRFIPLIALLGLGILTLPTPAAQAEGDQVRGNQVQLTRSPEAMLRLAHILNGDGEQTFQALIVQAETIAQVMINQGFATHSAATEIEVNILAERSGQVMPILTVTLSRDRWQNQPTLQTSTRYLANSAALLGFERSTVSIQTVAIRVDPVELTENEPNYYGNDD